MRLILLMASLVIVALVVMKSYPVGTSMQPENYGSSLPNSGSSLPMDPIQKAGQVNQLMLDAANQQRQALEKQLQ